jgi:hypothetical protein
MLTLPLAFVFWESFHAGSQAGISIIGKWFLFWAVGMRLFVAGCRQIINPAFTAREIFHIKDAGSLQSV